MRKICLLLWVVLFGTLVLVACDNVCVHQYVLVESRNSTCVEKGYDLYQCSNCQTTKKEENESFGIHIYDTEYTCQDRKCITKNCGYIEKASSKHEYTKEYVCSGCKTPKACTLEIIGRDYSNDILNQARINAGALTGNFEIVVLDKESTIQNLQNYKTSSMDKEKIIGGLFVKFDVTGGINDAPFTIYYNFALQFSEEQKSDIEFSYEGSDETWKLEVVDGNKTILFEYSILQ